MLDVVRKSAATVAIAAVLASPAAVASAAPMIDGSALKTAAPVPLEDVRWHGGWGWGLGAFAAGAIIGGALAAPYYYGPGYYPGPYYPAPYYARPYYEGAPAGDVAYCAQRYRSYDPASGTFLGNDGHRHPCP
jgi:hypothetical protein